MLEADPAYSSLPADVTQTLQLLTYVILVRVVRC